MAIGEGRGWWLRGAAMLLLLIAILAAAPANSEQKYLEPGQAFALTAAMASPTELDVRYRIAPGYYMYRERFKFALAPDAQRLGSPVLPNGIVKYDPNFEKDVEIYHDRVLIRIPVKAGAAAPLTLDVTGQGCADAGLCYPPMTTALILHPTAAGYTVSGPGTRADGNPVGERLRFDAALKLGDTGLATFLAGAGWGEIILLCLALGLLLSFTPCVLPMVPILLAMVAGSTTTAGGAPARVSRWRGLALTGSYVLGMSLVYTALGIAAGLIGASLSVWLQTPWVLAAFAVMLALLALAMFDVFAFQTPGGLAAALSRTAAGIPGGRIGASFVVGMVSALIVGPCMAAPLAGVLLFISQTGNVVLGGVALFALAWGQGILLLAVGGSSGALLPRAGAWMNGIKHFFGLLLLATAWWMVNSVLPGWLVTLGWAVLAAWSAVMLGAFEPLRAEAGQGRVLRKAVGLLMALWATLIIVGVAGGAHDAWQPLRPWWPPARQTAAVAVPAPSNAAAVASTAFPRVSPAAVALATPPRVSLARGPAGAETFTKVSSSAQLDALLAHTTRPVMLDFYADWCTSCLEMQKFTFSDPRVAELMSRFLLVQADVTDNSADDRALLRRFRLFGPPGIMFFDTRGKLVSDARVIGFEDARQFTGVLDGVLAASEKRAAATPRS